MAAFIESVPAYGREPDVATIGCIGLGNVGSGMAANLVKAGHAVWAFDLSASALEAAVTAGCAVRESAAGAAASTNAIVTMLPAGKHVR